MGIIVWFRFIVTVIINVGVLLASLIALVDAARVPERQYEVANNRTKRFWLLMLAGGLVVSVLGALGMVGIMLNLIAIAPAAAYWYGVRHDLRPARPASGIADFQTMGGWRGAKARIGRRRAKRAESAIPLDSRAAGNPNDPRFDV